MALYISSSRYISSSFNDTSTSSIPISIRKTTYAPRYYVYTSIEGDTFDRIAARTLGDPARYWEVADINAHVQFPDSIPAGTRMRIPAA